MSYRATKLQLAPKSRHNRSSCRLQLHVTAATEFQRIPDLPDRLRIVSADITELLSRISLRTASISFELMFAVLDIHQEGWPPPQRVDPELLDASDTVRTRTVSAVAVACTCVSFPGIALHECCPASILQIMLGCSWAWRCNTVLTWHICLARQQGLVRPRPLQPRICWYAKVELHCSVVFVLW